MPYRHEPSRVPVDHPRSLLGWVLIAALVWVIVIAAAVAVSRSEPPSSHQDATRTGTPRTPVSGAAPRPAVSAAPTFGVQTGGVPLTVRYVGTATWYCGHGAACTRGYRPSDLIAAIDRKDTTFRKGDRVTVRYGHRHVTVRIVDVCACIDRRVIDLSTGAFSRLAPLGLGVLPVTVERAGSAIQLPATDEVTP